MLFETERLIIRDFDEMMNKNSVSLKKEKIVYFKHTENIYDVVCCNTRCCYIVSNGAVSKLTNLNQEIRDLISFMKENNESQVETFLGPGDFMSVEQVP